jgi:hypothetical protein
MDATICWKATFDRKFVFSANFCVSAGLDSLMWCQSSVWRVSSTILSSQSEWRVLYWMMDCCLFFQPWHSLSKGKGVKVALKVSALALMNALEPTPLLMFCMKVGLFAGRRSSDRVFLLLQNLFCAYFMPGYIGTSSIFAVRRIDEALAVQGLQAPERKAVIGEHHFLRLSMYKRVHRHTYLKSHPAILPLKSGLQVL